jgi:molybdate transport system substrate-binding protein
MRKITTAVASLLVLALASGSASAADLKVFITSGAKPVMMDVASQFEKSTGHKLSVTYQGSAVLQEAIERDDSFDAAVLIASNMDAVVKSGRVNATSRVNLARSGLGVVVRAGQPKPDISTVDAFKRTMLNAKSIAYVTRGASGTHFIAVCEKLGIADQVKAKGKTLPTGTVAEFVAKGEAELAVQQMSELVGLKGTDIVGPFPPELNLVSQIVGAISANTKEPEAAKAFVKFFTSPEVTAVIKAKGMEPG